ncbi:MAG: YHYH protein [Burkholderiaceae bacterium]
MKLPESISQPRMRYSPAIPALCLVLASAACGGSDDSGSNVATTAPDAPTIDTVTAGDASATIAFSPPSSDGGAVISGYTLTCMSASGSVSEDAADSPIQISGLVNADVYSCTLVASNATGDSSASNPVSLTPMAAGTGTTSTASAACTYSYSAFNSDTEVNLMSTVAWSCGSTERSLTANGVPDHEVGPFGGAVNSTVLEQTISATFNLNPVYADQVTDLGGPAGVTSYMLNGVKTDPNTGGSCDDTGTVCSATDPSGNWSIEALTQPYFFSVDDSNAHIQPGGLYHYHGMPEGLVARLSGGDVAITLIGWAADGFPVYARYGYTDPNDAGSALKAMTGSYQLVTTVPANRPDTNTYLLGSFRQDWEYVAGSGDLDECNGRYGVTPEFPNGIYHYYAIDTYPFLQRCVKGEYAGGGGGGGGGMPPVRQ